MKKTAIILGLALCGQAFAFGASSEEGRKGNRKDRLRKMAKQLDLSEDQIAKIRSIKKGSKEEAKDKKELRKKFKNELEEMLRSPEKGEAYNAKLKEKHSKLLELGNQARQQRFSTMLKIRDELSPEQIKKFNEFRSKKRGRGKRGGKGRH